MSTVNTVAAEWAWFEENVLVKDEQTTAEGVAEFRALFYAGAKAMQRVVATAPDPMAALAALDAELAAYGMEATRTGKVPPL